jgi:carbamoyl-phosphate synthase small subunit
MNALFALEDGTCLTGKAFGATGTVTGEACFNTSMTGYQEVLTDPSYRGQIVAMTYPLIGNYGVNELDNESASIHVRGFVVGELARRSSNWRSRKSLDQWMKEEGIPGIEGIDTRLLTKRLRTQGAMRSVLTTEAMTAEQAVELARNSPPMEGMDYVKEVSTGEPYHWDADQDASCEWTIPNGVTGAATDGTDGCRLPLPPARYRLVAYDFGIKRNILRRLRQAGFDVEVMPSTTKAADVLAKDPDGVFLSNGPGDPAALDYIHGEIRQFIGKKPLFAICLGHQILAHAMGAKTFKLKFGHRGGNQPVKDLRTGSVAITSQNHGFAVDGDTLPPEIEITHINLNDQTVEGIRHREHPVFSVQYHPEAAPGPHDARYFFAEFANLIEQTRKPR